MKLGTDTNSMTNHIMSRSVIGQPEPQIGMGCTVLHWTDRTAATVIRWDGKILAVRADNAKRIDKNGISESQEYEYTANPNGHVWFFRKNKNGTWENVTKNYKTNRWNKASAGLLLGKRHHYDDPSF